MSPSLKTLSLGNSRVFGNYLLLTPARGAWDRSQPEGGRGSGAPLDQVWLGLGSQRPHPHMPSSSRALGSQGLALRSLKLCALAFFSTNVLSVQPAAVGSAENCKLDALSPQAVWCWRRLYGGQRGGQGGVRGRGHGMAAERGCC